jgi:hypothetical protein
MTPDEVRKEKEDLEVRREQESKNKKKKRARAKEENTLEAARLREEMEQAKKNEDNGTAEATS